MGWGADIASAVGAAAQQVSGAAAAGYDMAKALVVSGLSALGDGAISAGASGMEWALDREVVRKKFAAAGGSPAAVREDPYHERPIQNCAVMCCPGSPLAAKAARRKARKALIENAPVDDPARRAAAKRLEQDMDAVEQAKLSHHVYEEDGNPPLGHSVVSDADLEDMGIDPGALRSPEGFKAQIYKTDEKVFGEEKYVLVFKGTEFTNPDDWKQNVRQGAGKDSSYYRSATDLSKQMKQSGKPFAVSGHSLGGGMAAAAAQVSGVRATTFNAAGLHDRTVPRYAADSGPVPLGPPAINAYHVEGEVLTRAQSHPLSPMPTAPGKPVPVAPHDPALGSLSRHGMQVVIDSIEKRKRDDEQVLGG